MNVDGTSIWNRDNCNMCGVICSMEGPAVRRAGVLLGGSRHWKDHRIRLSVPMDDGTSKLGISRLRMMRSKNASANSI